LIHRGIIVTTFYLQNRLAARRLRKPKTVPCAIVIYIIIIPMKRYVPNGRVINSSGIHTAEDLYLLDHRAFEQPSCTHIEHTHTQTHFVCPSQFCFYFAHRSLQVYVNCCSSVCVDYVCMHCGVYSSSCVQFMSDRPIR